MDSFLAEIRIFSGNFAPKGWAFCDGSLLPIRNYTALFSLLGTYYGGDGKTTFALPNLQGSAPMHWGQGTGLSNRYLGQTGGETGVTLQTNQLGGHTHPLNAIGGRSPIVDNLTTPASNTALASTPDNASLYLSPPANATNMSTSGTGLMGGNQPHNNMQPYLALSFIISLQGIFPQRQ